MPYLSFDPMTDRDRIKRGFESLTAPVERSEFGKLIFRNMFLDDKDAEIAKVLWNYFEAVAERWPLAAGPEATRKNLESHDRI